MRVLIAGGRLAPGTRWSQTCQRFSEKGFAEDLPRRAVHKTVSVFVSSLVLEVDSIKSALKPTRRVQVAGPDHGRSGVAEHLLLTQYLFTAFLFLKRYILLCRIEHPYLLADNRHYPFYLWRWVFKRHVAVKYLLVPLYLYAATSLVLSLGELVALRADCFLMRDVFFLQT